jgi:hypothetical protein
MKMKLVFAFALVVLGSARSGACAATTTTYDWTAVVTAGDAWNGLQPGDAISGSLTFPPDNSLLFSQPGVQVFSGPTAAALVAGVTFTQQFPAGWGVTATSQAGYDALASGSDGVTTGTFDFSFSDGAPAPEGDLEGYATKTLVVGFDSSGQPHKEANALITALVRRMGAPVEDAAPVPEPSTLALLGSGLTAFLLFRRKGV